MFLVELGFLELILDYLIDHKMLNENAALVLESNKDLNLEKYLDLFSEKTKISKGNIQRWIPIVAATQMTKNIEEEQEFLSKWINVVDFE